MPVVGEHPWGTREVSVLGGTCGEGVGDLPVIHHSFLWAQLTFDLHADEPTTWTSSTTHSSRRCRKMHIFNTEGFYFLSSKVKLWQLALRKWKQCEVNRKINRAAIWFQLLINLHIIFTISNFVYKMSDKGEKYWPQFYIWSLCPVAGWEVQLLKYFNWASVLWFLNVYDCQLKNTNYI